MPPRNIAGPVVRGADLWGRTRDIQELWDLLEKGSVLLAGPRRYGKSSLMYALVDQPRDGWRVVALHVEYVETPPELLTELTARLLHTGALGAAEEVRGLAGRFGRWLGAVFDGEAKAAVPALGEIKIRLREGIGRDWRALAEEVIRRLEAMDGDLLIILDEFPVMIGQFMDRNEADGLAFLRWFRAQRHRQSRHRVRWLLGGSVNIEPRLMRLGRSEVLNDLLRGSVRGMTEQEAASFVTDVLAGEGADAEDGVAEEIVRICGARVHFFLQVVIEQSLAAARHAGRRLRVEDVRATYDVRVLGPESRARFDHYRSRLSRHYGPLEEPARITLGHLARSPDGVAGRDELFDLFHPGELDQDGFDELITMLAGDYYVVEDQRRLSFTTRFLRDWWSRNVPGGR